jgi:FkbM family methyltransferase
VKNFIKYILQSIFGYDKYLRVFAVFKIKTLHLDKNENDFFEFLNLIDSKKGVIIDVGANIGIMTYHLAKRFSGNQVFSIEPINSNFKILQYIVNKYHLFNVKLFQLALGDYSGEAKMILPQKNNVLFQGLSHIKDESIDNDLEGIEYSVQIQKLDELMGNQAVSAIKIDVENFEYFVLKGAENVIKTNQPIIYAELWQNENREKCFEFMTNLDYSINVVMNKKITMFNKEIHHSQNFVFIPKN